MAVSAQDYLGEPTSTSFQIAECASKTYETCSQLLLHYYTESHKSISPFTGTTKDFFATLSIIKAEPRELKI
ncbi:hypothetical protein [Streptococcus acidominimus]|uniref:Uncharacterized protein n=1 Tax=Streptococcus acidominimus TaxID=1326 RepID=A0A4Y9FNK9_STRAI|nr:hypothetical protein [Streptococcus acidominimus]MBF0838719.1 hypothetical protein [Streptococcus acidominimus]MBF0846788.1 hypothetical protein [Streptococcus danieliae]TFU30807.1 hypothetical protein E4U01_04750 [Streptococcus acidominimus]